MPQPRYEILIKSAIGFSLVEILIVVSLLGIIALVVVPAINSTDPKKLDITTNEVVHAIRFAHAEAIRLGKPVGFSVQTLQKQIRVFSLDTSSSPWTPIYDIYHPLSKKLYNIQLSTFPNAAVDTVVLNVTYKSTCNITGRFYFDTYGTPWCLDPNNITLDEFKVELSLGEHMLLVDLDPVTGRVSIN